MYFTLLIVEGGGERERACTQQSLKYHGKRNYLPTFCNERIQTCQVLPIAAKNGE